MNGGWLEFAEHQISNKSLIFWEIGDYLSNSPLGSILEFPRFAPKSAWIIAIQLNICLPWKLLGPLHVPKAAAATAAVVSPHYYYGQIAEVNMFIWPQYGAGRQWAGGDL